MFELLKIDFDTMYSPLEEFYHQCQWEGIPNNSSKKSMKVGVFAEEHWWAFWDKGRIISMSGCYKCDDFGAGGWRLLFRSATLKAYRGKAGRFSRDLNHDFCFGHLLKVQIAFARQQRASHLFFTTNSSLSGDRGSFKANRVVEKVLLPLGKVKLIKSDHTYYWCKQNIWEVL